MNLERCTIVEQAHALLDGQGDESVGLYLAIERKLETVAAPGVSWEMDSADTSLLRAIAGKRRDVLTIKYSGLKEYAVLILTRPWGAALHVSWLLIVSPRVLNDIRRAVRLTADGDSRFEVGSELDVLDVLDLNGFLAVTKLALKTAIRELTGADPKLSDEERADSGRERRE